jgi:predicted nuclease with TOPRIM domain
MVEEGKSWDIIKEEAFKVSSLEEAQKFLHVAECCQKEMEEDLQKVKGAVVILKERIAELKGTLERRELAAALRRKNKPSLGTGDDI